MDDGAQSGGSLPPQCSLSRPIASVPRGRHTHFQLQVPLLPDCGKLKDPLSIRREVRQPNRSWRMDETYVRVAGKWTYGAPGH